MNKLEIELVQHTPIIQFQGQQKGAVLRGTEVKPKLDKFLIKYIFKEFNQYKQYLIGYKEGMTEEDFFDKKPLNYKIRFKTSGKIDSNKINKNTSFYFNNIGDSDKIDANRLVFVNNGKISVEFFSLNRELIKAIDDNFDDFLLINNFGFRQNKTFGSFTSKRDNRKNEDIINRIKELKDNNKIYYIEYEDNIKDDTMYNKIRDDAYKIYQYMKSGISYPKKEESYLFKYMNNNENIKDEKQFIVNNIFNKGNDGDKCQYRYERAVLGVCDYIDYKTLPNKKKGGVVKYESTSVERYKSPILFKIIGNILIIISEEDTNIYDEKFYFKKEGCKKGKEIRTPSKEEFNLDDFLKCFFDSLNKNTNFKKKHKLAFKGKIEVK
ncbi:hypothetical protein SAMN04487886_11134 [Clostridium sp. DSM 8431]|uniref:hypothetical protein n=1 Tax=Clostridium sp. DSM 8431 TaxID=1761781 RepID=UPI0008E91D59|nr:hypothetical protein [Clostridium sp. DSM 8431]SFU71071.1 hypothetical protein SAMN04487886_11134 [Clostridium sp. DSM 8431]